MFIHDLDCGWMAHPFVRNRFVITHRRRNSQDPACRHPGCNDRLSARGLDVDDAPTLEEAQRGNRGGGGGDRRQAGRTAADHAGRGIRQCVVSIRQAGGRRGAQRDAGCASGQGRRTGQGIARGRKHHRFDSAQCQRLARPVRHQEQGRLHVPAFGQRVHVAGGVLPLAQDGRQLRSIRRASAACCTIPARR